MESLRIAAVNAAPVPADVDGNVRRAVEWCAQAAEQNVDLLLFPEAWTTGYDAAAFEDRLPPAEELGWLDPLQQAVDAAGLVVLLNSALQHRDGSRTLTTIALVPGAPARCVYDKQHLFPPEVDTFTAGTDGASIVLHGHEIAISVCYDIDFPEHAAAAAASGATIYVNSGAYFPGSEGRRDLRNAARALDNGMYLLFSGLAVPGETIGGSAVFDPLGRPLAQRGLDEGLVVADVDPEVIRGARESQRAWADRRTSLGSRRRLLVECAAR